MLLPVVIAIVLLDLDRDAAERCRHAMTLHFAYGANMSRAVMRHYAPGARALGVAELAGHRFVITADGYASVEPARARPCTACCGGSRRATGSCSTPGRMSSGGLYRAETLAVRRDGRRVPALVYLARPGGQGGRSPAISSL